METAIVLSFALFLIAAVAAIQIVREVILWVQKRRAIRRHTDTTSRDGAGP